MPAKSKAQKTAMCMALAARKGDLEVSKLKGAALEIYNSDMTNKEIEEFTVMESLQNYLNKNMKNLTQYITESKKKFIIWQDGDRFFGTPEENYLKKGKVKDDKKVIEYHQKSKDEVLDFLDAFFDDMIEPIFDEK